MSNLVFECYCAFTISSKLANLFCTWKHKEPLSHLKHFPVRAIIGFIPDSKFEGKKGICSLFLELFPGFFYLSAFFVFFEEFGSYLSTKRTEPHGLSTTNLGLFGTVKEIIRKIPSLSGVLLVASVLVAILFVLHFFSFFFFLFSFFFFLFSFFSFSFSFSFSLYFS